MKHFHNIIAFAFLLIFSASILAQEDAVDTYVRSQIGSLHIPGISVAIVRNGQVVKAKGYGLANVELNVPAAKNTVYELGSIGKQFTATAVMMLVEEGKINLDDKITKYFAGAPEYWNKITIRHLLTHTSGIQNHVAVPGYLKIFKTDITFETTPTREAIVQEFFNLPKEFEPGETWAYDNTGYYLLGLSLKRRAANLLHVFGRANLQTARNDFDPQHRPETGCCESRFGLRMGKQ
jgi:CubicO group peptidase (beta-lactamase class C family)